PSCVLAVHRSQWPYGSSAPAFWIRLANPTRHASAGSLQVGRWCILNQSLSFILRAFLMRSLVSRLRCRHFLVASTFPARLKMTPFSCLPVMPHPFRNPRLSSFGSPPLISLSLKYRRSTRAISSAVPSKAGYIDMSFILPQTVTCIVLRSLPQSASVTHLFSLILYTQ